MIVGRWAQGATTLTNINAWATGFDTISAPAAATPFLQTFEGIVKMSTDALSAPVLMLYSEVAASNVEVLPGSFIEFKKVS